MQQPLLHPGDTIYHAPSFPCALFTTRAFSAAHRAKKVTSLKKNVVHSGANYWELNAKPVTFQQDRTN